GAANTAANLCALGAHVAFLGVIGQDAPGALLRSIFREQGIDDRWLVEDEHTDTPHKVRILADGQYVVRFDFRLRLRRRHGGANRTAAGPARGAPGAAPGRLQGPVPLPPCRRDGYHAQPSGGMAHGRAGARRTRTVLRAGYSAIRDQADWASS